MIRKVLLLFILFPVICFGQNINSQFADWYFYHPLEFKGETNRINYFPSGLTVLCDTIKVNGGDKTIKLFPTIREKGNFDIASDFTNAGKTKPSILGSKIRFTSDSIVIFFDSTKFTIDLLTGIHDTSVFYFSDSLTLKLSLDSLNYQQKLNVIDSIYYFSVYSFGNVNAQKQDIIKEIKIVYGKKLGFLETPDFYKILHGSFNINEDQYWLNYANSPNIGGWGINEGFFYDFEFGDEFYFERSFGYYSLLTQKFQRILGKDSAGIDSITYSLFEYSKKENYSPPTVPFHINYEQGIKSITYKINDKVILPYSRVWVPPIISGINNSYSYFPIANLYLINNRFCLSTEGDIYSSINPNIADSIEYTFPLEGFVFETIYCQGLGNVYRKYRDDYWPDYFLYLIDYKKGSEVLTGLGNEINIKSKTKSVISPNPASGYFQIDLIEKITLVEIFNEKGQRLKVFNHSSSFNYTISDIPSGIYFVKIHTSDNEFTEKLIIE